MADQKKINYKYDKARLHSLLAKQMHLLSEGVSIMVKHYQSGTFSYSVMTHNGDATGWTQISHFIGKGSYNYMDALEDGIKWYEKYKNGEEFSGNDVKIASGSDFGNLVKVKL